MRVPFVKGHGTENDFLIVPDADGRQGPPTPALVRSMCDRRAGLGADGLIRAVRTDAADDPFAVAARGGATWFMDYVNSDGSLSEMCGNGVRVFGRYLVEREGADPAQPLLVATRAGIKLLLFDEEGITVDMGSPAVLGTTRIGVGSRSWEAVHVSMGNPHAVAFVDDLSHAGPLLDEPVYDRSLYPGGVNVEFVVRRGPGRVAMRVHERGSGETRSCGTGACAVMVATALADGAGPGSHYTVELPGGVLGIRWTEEDRILMRGPAVLVAEGYWLADC